MGVGIQVMHAFTHILDKPLLLALHSKNIIFILNNPINLVIKLIALTVIK